MVDIINNGIHWFIALYGRVSTSLQEDQETIQNQIMAMKDFADKKFGPGNYTIVRQYLDEGWSGDNIVRPKLDELRVDSKKKIWDAVMIYDPDRLARRYSLQELVMDELKEAGIEVFFVTVSTPKNMEDKILYGVRGLFSEYERAKISERFRLGKLRKVKNGHILTTEALYGYSYIRNNKETKTHGYYVINEEEAVVVRMIFVWVGEEKLTLRQVVRRLQELGIKPRRSKRGVWATSTLTTMLRHKGYTGQGHWGSSYAVVPVNPIKTEKYRQVKKTSRRIKPEAEWIAPNIPIPRIIDDELFMKVRAQLKTKFVLFQQRTTNKNRKDKIKASGIDIDTIQKNITKLKEQVDRYNNAYGAGLFSLEKLKEYTIPRNKQKEELESQIRKVEQEESNINVATMPTENQVKIFSEEISETLENLSFEARQAIIRSTVGKIIGTQKQLQVSGSIPLSLYQNVVYKTNDRHSRFAQCGEVHAF